VDKPEAPQSAIRIGRVAPARLTPDYHALRAMNTLLGGSFTSRLNDNLREQHGYTYGAGSGFVFGRSSGVFLAGSDVQTDATAAALGEFLKEFERISVPPTDDEAERARNYLALGYAEAFETTREIASQIVEQVVYELPGDFFNTFVPKVLAVDANEMSRVAKAHIDPLNLAIVVVGDRAKAEQPLRELGVGPVKVMSVQDVMGPAPTID
jgi:predicted Zn-dependent peptidase